MNILIIGSGGREHALCWKLKQSIKCKKLFCMPGNGGISELAECIEIDPLKKNEVYRFCKESNIDLVVIGPELYLEDGLSDFLLNKKISVFGPSKKASKLETSKVFSKKFLEKNKIPTARFKTFKSFDKIKSYLNNSSGPFVIKVDGLASGKGVLISNSKDEAIKNSYEILINEKFGGAGKKIVLEEFLDGFEISYFIFLDKNTYHIIDYALDHKKLKDGDIGPNTGGMGAFSPSNKVTEELKKRINEEVIIPTVNGLKNENIIYRGVLFIGLMITSSGPKVIEYNVRFGDPECQVIMRRYDSDLLTDILKITNDNLNKSVIKIKNNYCICVVLTSNGYPKKYKKDSLIENIKIAENIPGIKIFHSGTRKEKNKFFSNGGRVLSVTAMNKSKDISKKKVYEALKVINWQDGFYRKDIGKKNFD